MAAMRNLSYSAFMLYAYCALNANSYEFGLSKAFLCENTALSKNTYYNAFHELKEKRYLVLHPGSTTKYDFYEDPKSGCSTTQKQDTVYQEQVQNTNNNIEKSLLANWVANPMYDLSLSSTWCRMSTF